MIQIIPNFHPVVVHFPIALTIVSFVAALASQLFKKRVFANQLATVSHYLLWLAAATALVAVTFGWLAYNSVNHDNAGHAAMTVHKFWAFTTAAVLVLLALFDFKKHQSSTIMPMYLVCLLGLASALVSSTAWLGSEVVYRHGIGVMSLPEQENLEGRQHAHSAAEAHADKSQIEAPPAEPAASIKVTPNPEKPTKQGPDMNAMPMADEAMQAHDSEVANPIKNEHQEDGVKNNSPVQDESKPHTHKHKH